MLAPLPPVLQVKAVYMRVRPLSKTSETPIEKSMLTVKPDVDAHTPPFRPRIAALLIFPVPTRLLSTYPIYRGIGDLVSQTRTYQREQLPHLATTFRRVRKRTRDGGMKSRRIRLRGKAKRNRFRGAGDARSIAIAARISEYGEYYVIAVKGTVYSAFLVVFSTKLQFQTEISM